MSVLLVAAFATGRVELVGLAVPFAVGPALALARRGSAPPRPVLELQPQQAAEGEPVRATVRVGGSDHDAVVVTLRAEGLRPAESRLVLAPGSAATVALTAGRWGRHRVGPATGRAYGPGLLTRSPLDGPSADLQVQPAVATFAAGATMPRATAYAGVHRSRVLGPGVEFAGVRRFAPGDRPRRVNWRATLRSGELQLSATHTDRGAHVVVVLDTCHEVGPPGDTSLDAAVRAAAGIAEHYLGVGDAVGLVEFGGRPRRLLPGSGRAHLARVRDWLLDTRSVVSAATGGLRWPPAMPSAGALVVVLSPLLDERAAHTLVTLRQRGAAPVAVDTLPEGALPATRRPAEALAQRLWRLERELTLARLGDVGVPVVRWAGPGSLDGVLRDLARIAAAPRVRAR